MDYCDDPDDIHEVLRSASLCGECSRMVERQIGSGRMSTAQAADIMRLLNRAAGRRCAFMAFPLKEPFVSIATEIVAPAVHSAGWHPILAAESVGGRDITDAIRRGIFMCDLIIADVTGRNPNVYWEFGFAYALGKDHILLCQNRRLPFDVAALRCIFYSANSDVERSKLTTDLCNHLRQ